MFDTNRVRKPAHNQLIHLSAVDWEEPGGQASEHKLPKAVDQLSLPIHKSLLSNQPSASNFQPPSVFTPNLNLSSNLKLPANTRISLD